MEILYATKAGVHMMTGKAISQAVREHLLVDGVLNATILSDTLDVALPQQPGETEAISLPPQAGEAEYAAITPQPVREAEDAILPQQARGTEHAESQEVTDAQMSLAEDTPAGTENPDLDEIAALYAQVMERSV